MASGRLSGDDLRQYVEDAFLWERKHLYGHMALLALAREDADEAVLYAELAESQVAQA